MAAMKSYMQARDHVMCGDHLFDDLLEFPNGDDDSDLIFLMKTPAANYDDDDDDIAPLHLPDHPTTTTTGAPQLYSSSPPRLYGEEMGVGLFGVGDTPHPADDTNRDHDKTFSELDMAELEWVSNFMDDSSPDSFSLLDVQQHIPDNNIETSIINNNNNKDGQFRSPSPVSVLQQQLPNNSRDNNNNSTSSYCCSDSTPEVENMINTFRSSSSQYFSSPTIMSAIPVRPRSKRPRPTTFSARRHLTQHFSPPPDQIINKGKKKKKNNNNNNNNLLVSSQLDEKEDNKEMAAIIIITPGEEGVVMRRKCRHCQIEKTPQWRAGPMGPKTLCNACGVRYMKTGRLFQEYRPAASPTFVPSLHSNSHKKVIEMRINATTHAHRMHSPPNISHLLQPDHIIHMDY